MTSIKFLALGTDNHMELKTHIQQTVQKMSSACYAIIFMYHFSNINTLTMIYFAYVHSVMKYGIIFWGNSKDSKKEPFSFKIKLWELWQGLNTEFHVNLY